MIVITLTKVPAALRGDLTKWCQEIQTGVYVGHLSTRIREYLWIRVIEGIGRGEATMVYSANNELGYEFRTTRHDYQVMDYDGIPLMMHLQSTLGPVEHGFSNAARFRRARLMANKVDKSVSQVDEVPVVTLDLETTGLDANRDTIISIGAVKRTKTGELETFDQLVQINRPLPREITQLTGITTPQLREHGVALKTAMTRLQLFVGELPIIGYNLRFDEAFLTQATRKTNLPDFNNVLKDLMPVVKDVNVFLDNYRLETVLSDYDIKNSEPHRAISDAQATWKLADKLIKNGDFEI